MNFYENQHNFPWKNFKENRIDLKPPIEKDAIISLPIYKLYIYFPFLISELGKRDNKPGIRENENAIMSMIIQLLQNF